MAKRITLSVFVRLDEVEKMVESDADRHHYHSMSFPKPCWQAQVCESARLVGSHVIGRFLVLLYDWAPEEG